MSNWNEADHPRDDEGKFTFKGGGITSFGNSENKMQQRADILYPTMQDTETNNNQIDYSNIGLGNYNDGTLTGGAASIREHNKEYIEKLQDMAQSNSDKSFLNNLDFILKLEGGYNNVKGDVPTNLGVTQRIYNIYRKEKGLPIQSVKNINLEEAVPIYYRYFWKPSKADELQHPLDLVYFDMYVNSNPHDAKMVLSRSNNDVYTFIENRRKFYSQIAKNKPEKKQFEKGWNNRLNILKKYVDDFYSNSQ